MTLAERSDAAPEPAEPASGPLPLGAPGPGSAQAPPADSEWRRLSPRMLLIHPVRELIQNIPTLAVLLVAGHSTGGHGGWWSLIGVGVVIAASIGRWFTTRFRITPEQVQLRKGLVRRQTITTPADRVRSVDVSASALHRLLGLAKVEIGTGISDTKRDGLALDGLSATAADGLRAELLHRGRAAARAPRAVAAGAQDGPPPGSVPVPLPPPSSPAAQGASLLDVQPVGGPVRRSLDQPVGASFDEGVETELVRLRPGWIAYAPFTLSGILTAVAIGGIGSRFVNEANLDPSQTAAYRAAAGEVAAAPVWVSVLAGLLALVVLVALLSLIAYVLAFWGFRLTRHSGGTLHVQRGLVTTRAISIEERRLRGVEVSEPLLLRAVHGARLIAITTGLRVGRGAQRGGSMIVPPAPRDEVSHVAGEILHLLPAASSSPGASPAQTLAPAAGAALIDGPLVAHGPAARRRRWTRAVVPGLLLAVVALVLVHLDWPSFVLAVPVAVLVAAPFLAVDRYRSLGHASADGYLVTRFGSLVRRRSIVAADGVIGWNLDASLFQRRAGLVTLAATTAAGDQAYCVWDLPPDEALALARQATPGLLEQFLVPGRS